MMFKAFQTAILILDCLESNLLALLHMYQSILTQVNDIVSAGSKILCELRGVSEAEIEGAKAHLKTRLGRHFSTNWRRL